jgi:cytochrome P450
MAIEAGSRLQVPLRRRIAHAARRDDVQRPPGPRSRLPGLALAAMRRDPLGTLLGLARDHGDIAYVRLGPFDVYMVSDPDDIHDVLVTNGHAFMKGRGLQEAKRILGEGLLTSEGSFHRDQRRTIQPIFHHDRIDAYGPVMVDEALRLTDRWPPGATLDVNAEMMRLTLTIVGRTLFGVDLEADAADVRSALADVLGTFQRVTNPFGALLDRLPLPSTLRYRRAQSRLDGVIDRMVVERRAAGADGSDLLSMLISAQSPRAETDGGAGAGVRGMIDRQIRDEAMTLFLAGHETTAQLMTWTWFALSRSPRTEGRLHAELDTVLAGRPPEVADLVDLPFAGQVLREVLRMYPPAYVLGRLALEDVRIRGYRIPAGSTVLMSPYVVQHDPRWYPEPFRFDPDRWAGDRASERPRYASFPFGGGSRVCIGEGFAWMEAKMILATIAQRWCIRVPRDHLVELRPMVTLRPKGGMPARVERRSVP